MSKTVHIPSGGTFLVGKLYGASEGGVPRSGILLIHGWESAQDRMEDIAHLLSTDRDMVCLSIDLRGHGLTGGDLAPLSRKDFLDDVVAAYDFLATVSGVRSDAIGALGSSFGGYLVSLLTAERPLSWVVLRVPADYPDEGFDTPKEEQVYSPEWRKEPREWAQTAALRALHAYTGEVLIVESENDELVPHEMIMSYVKAASAGGRCTHECMKGAPHSLTREPSHKADFNRRVLSWYDQKIRTQE